MVHNEPGTLEDALLFIDVRASLLRTLCKGIQDTAMTGREDALERVLEMSMVLEDELSLLAAEIEGAEKLTALGAEPIKERRGHVLAFRQSTGCGQDGDKP